MCLVFVVVALILSIDPNTVDFEAEKETSGNVVTTWSLY